MAGIELAPILTGDFTIEDRQRVTEFRDFFSSSDFQSLSFPEQAQVLWTRASSSPAELGTGLTIVAAEALVTGDRRFTSFFQHLVDNKIPSLIGRTENRDTRFMMALHTISVTLAVLNNPESLEAFSRNGRGNINVNKVLDTLGDEEQLLLLKVIRSTVPESHDVSIISPTQERLHNRLLSQGRESNFSVSGLRMAVAASLLKSSGNSDDRPGIYIPIHTLGENYLDNFRNRYREQPVEGLSIVAAATKDCLTEIRRTLEELVATRSLVPLLRGVVSLAQREIDQGTPEMAVKVLKEIIKHAFERVKSPAYKTLSAVPFLEQVHNSLTILQQEKIVIAKAFAMVLEDTGYRFDSLTDEDLIIIAYGNYELFTNIAINGSPIVLKAGGAVTKTVGHFEIPGFKAKESRIKTADFRRLPALEIKTLTPQERVTGILRGIFPDELSDEEIDTIAEQSDDLWADIEPRGLRARRTSTLNPVGVRLKLDSDRVAIAKDDSFPQIEIKQTPEIQDRSDLSGIIRFAGNLAFSFYLDKRGGLQGPLSDWANSEVLSLDLYLQLNHLVLLMFQGNLVMPNAERQRRYEAHVRNLSEESLDASRNGHKKVSGNKLAIALENAREYQRVIKDNLGQIIAVELDEERLISRLSPGHSENLAVPLTEDELREGSRKKGSAKPYSVAGSMVFLPEGYSPRRTAIENARAHNVTLYSITGYFMDEFGNTTRIVAKTTYRSTSEVVGKQPNVQS